MVRLINLNWIKGGKSKQEEEGILKAVSSGENPVNEKPKNQIIPEDDKYLIEKDIENTDKDINKKFGDIETEMSKVMNQHLNIRYLDSKVDNAREEILKMPQGKEKDDMVSKLNDLYSDINQYNQYGLIHPRRSDTEDISSEINNETSNQKDVEKNKNEDEEFLKPLNLEELGEESDFEKGERHRKGFSDIDKKTEESLEDIKNENPGLFDRVINFFKKIDKAIHEKEEEFFKGLEKKSSFKETLYDKEDTLETNNTGNGKNKHNESGDDTDTNTEKNHEEKTYFDDVEGNSSKEYSNTGERAWTYYNKEQEDDSKQKEDSTSKDDEDPRTKYKKESRQKRRRNWEKKKKNRSSGS